jgi:predicted metalloprotease
MDLRGRRRSSNVEDRRGMRVSRPVAGVGIVGLLIGLVLALFGINPLPFIAGFQQVNQNNVEMVEGDQPYQETAAEAQVSDMLKAVLAETENVWTELLPRFQRQYAPPTLVLFKDAVQSACGTADAAVGPFYCPQDQKIYIDTAFYDDLDKRFGAPGDFAQAYVLAHEVGHHVQTLLGISNQVREAQARNPGAQNQIQVMMELQADCFAGVWAARTQAERPFLEQGDIEEGLRAASAIGDDRIQRQTQGYVQPDSFTHGSAEQRVRWFRKGLQTGDPASCDTFNAPQL